MVANEVRTLLTGRGLVESPGSGQVLATEVDVPGAGWP